MTINTRWFRIDLLTSSKDAFAPDWRWRPVFIQPWDRARAVSWGRWHWVITRNPNAAERREGRREFKRAVREFRAQSKREGWELA